MPEELRNASRFLDFETCEELPSRGECDVALFRVYAAVPELIPSYRVRIGDNVMLSVGERGEGGSLAGGLLLGVADDAIAYGALTPDMQKIIRDAAIASVYRAGLLKREEPEEVLRARLETARQAARLLGEMPAEQMPEGALEVLLPGIVEKKARPRPSKAGLDTLPALRIPGKMPTHGPLNTTIQQAFFSRVEDGWQFGKNSSFLDLPSGRVVAEGVTTLEVLRQLLSCDTGAEGLQYTCAAVAVYEAAMKAMHGRLPEDYRKCTPVVVHAADLLRAIGRAPRGAHGGYSREEQLRARRFLKAASVFQFVNVKPIDGGTARVQAGPILAVLGAEIESALPGLVEDGEGGTTGEVISLYIMPGPGFYELLRKGAHWVPLPLLHYHPMNDKYAIAAGFYLANLMMIRRSGKQQGEGVTLGTIEREARIDTFDKKPAVRLRKLEEALHKLARDGVIGGEGGRAPIEDDSGAVSMGTVEALRARRLMLVIPPAMLEKMTGRTALPGPDAPG